MPANSRSLEITDRYRQRLGAIRDHATRIATRGWHPDPAVLDRSHAAWVAQTASALTELQRAGARLSVGYLTAFLSSELGRRVPPVGDATLAEPGKARDGRPLAEALVPPLFTVKAAIRDGRDFAEASRLGLVRASRLVGEEAVAPARQVVHDGIQSDDRIIGWRRVTGGGCGACLAAATGAIQADDEVLEVHPACQCTKEAVVAHVPDRVQRPTGRQMFDDLPASGQDALLGGEKAALIRSGEVPFHALIEKQPQEVLPTVITERPLEALKHQ